MFAASLAVSAVTGVVSYVGQKRTAEARVEAQEANNEALRTAAISDMVQSSGDLNVRQQQETAATALNISNQKLNTRRAASTAAASSESAGLSYENLLADYDQQFLNYSDSQMQQLGFNVEQIQRNRESIQARTEGRINTGWDNTPITMPSFGGTMLGIAGDAMSAYGDYGTKDPLTGEFSL